MSRAADIENRVLAAFGTPKHDLDLSTDEVVDRIDRAVERESRRRARGGSQIGRLSDVVLREEVVAALERLSDRRVLYRFGEGRARIWRMLGFSWDGGEEEDL